MPDAPHDASADAVHVATKASSATSVHSHAAALPVNASPLESPQHVAPSRISRPFRVSIPESAPHTLQYSAAAVNVPIWSMMSACPAAV